MHQLQAEVDAFALAPGDAAGAAVPDHLPPHILQLQHLRHREEAQIERNDTGI